MIWRSAHEASRMMLHKTKMRLPYIADLAPGQTELLVGTFARSARIRYEYLATDHSEPH